MKKIESDITLQKLVNRAILILMGIPFYLIFNTKNSL